MQKPARMSAFWAFWGGLYLLALYFATIWVAVGALSAIQVRADLEQLSPVAQPGQAASPLTFADVKHAYERFEERRVQIERERVNADPSRFAYVEVDANLARIAALVGQPTVPPVEFETSPVFLENVTACRSATLAASADFKDIAGAPDASLCDLIALHFDLDATADDVAAASNVEAALEKANEIARTKLDTLRASEPLRAHFDDYTFFTSLGYDRFLHMPRHVMVLLLTMAMGALGSVVTMTWLFVRQDSGLTLRRFVILPFIGTMSAFIILIFLSAGQLTLNAGDSDVGLNPFVLSFVGVISGVLSERAYLRISEIGTNFFVVDDGQPRWGFRLQDAVTESGLTVADLAQHLGTTEDEAGRIVSESTTATLPQQRLIAAALRRPIRELFTDVPPDGPTVSPPVQVRTPDLIGADPLTLERTLGDLGLAPGARTEAPADGVPPGRIQAQVPAPGTRVPLRTAVAYTVAVASAAPDTPDEG